MKLSRLFGALATPALAALSLLLSPAAKAQIPFNWVVAGTGTETWYTTDPVYQTKTLSTYSPSNNVSGVFSDATTVTAAVTGPVNYSFNITWTDGDFSGGWAYIKDKTSNTIILNALGGTYAGGYGLNPYPGSTNSSGIFMMQAGHSYFFEASADGNLPDIYATGWGTGTCTLGITFPIGTQLTPHTATRANYQAGNNFVLPSDVQKNVGGFYAPPQPQNGGTISGVYYSLAYNTPQVTVFFQSTHSLTTVNPNDPIIAAPSPPVLMYADPIKSPTNIVFRVPQSLLSTYLIRGSYWANGVTNSYAGTPTSGPISSWTVGSLQPATAYGFSFYLSDTNNNLNGAPVTLNASTLPLPPKNVFVVGATTNEVLFSCTDLPTNASIGGKYWHNGVTNLFSGNSYGNGPGLLTYFGAEPLPAGTTFGFSLAVQQNGVTSTEVPATASTVPFPPAVPQISSLSKTLGGFGFSVLGTPGFTNIVQASTNLQTWTPLSNILPTNSPFQFVDADASKFPHRFYRMAVLPSNPSTTVPITAPGTPVMVSNAYIDPSHSAVGLSYSEAIGASSVNLIYQLNTGTSLVGPFTNSAGVTGGTINIPVGTQFTVAAQGVNPAGVTPLSGTLTAFSAFAAVPSDSPSAPTLVANNNVDPTYSTETFSFPAATGAVSANLIYQLNTGSSWAGPFTNIVGPTGGSINVPPSTQVKAARQGVNPLGTDSVSAYSTNFSANYQQEPAVGNSVTTSALSGWPLSNAFDHNIGTVWSSNVHNTPTPATNEVITYWFSGDAFTNINYVRMTPRYHPTTGFGLCFPESLAIYTASATNGWVLQKVVTDIPRPYGGGDVIYTFPKVYCNGICVVENQLSDDFYGNYAFQLEELESGFNSSY